MIHISGDKAFVAYGHGYEVSDRGRCTAFDGYEVICEPLKDREQRVFYRTDHATGRQSGTCYRSHSIKLARNADQRYDKNLYILVHHGGGREVLRLRYFWDDGALERTIYHMNERAQYALLYTIWETACKANRQGVEETTNTWQHAAAEKRIKTRKYPTKGIKVWIEPKKVEA